MICHPYDLLGRSEAFVALRKLCRYILALRPVHQTHVVALWNEIVRGWPKRSEVSKRGWRTEGVGAKKPFKGQRFRSLFCTPFPMPP